MPKFNKCPCCGHTKPLPHNTIDLSTIITRQDFYNANWDKFRGDPTSAYIKHVLYPVKQDDLNRMVGLGLGTCSWSMGELFVNLQYNTVKIK